MPQFLKTHLIKGKVIFNKIVAMFIPATLKTNSGESSWDIGDGTPLEFKIGEK